MYAIREIKQTTSDNLSLKIPDFLQNRKVEILVFPYDESSHQKLSINTADSIEKLSWDMGKRKYTNRDELHERS